MRAVVLAVLAALAVQPLVFLCWFVLPLVFSSETIDQRVLRELLGMIALVLLFAAVHLALLGLPAFFLLKHSKRLVWPNILAAGFVIGAIGIAALSWPLNAGPGSSSSSTWHGEMRDMVVNGVPTLYGWLSYLEGVLVYGLQGFLGAAAFYWTWRRHAT
jgi:hypothetical protein